MDNPVIDPRTNPKGALEMLHALGCIDHDCVVAGPRPGQRTCGGGCRCVPRSLPTSDRAALREALTMGHKAVAALVDAASAGAATHRRYVVAFAAWLRRHAVNVGPYTLAAEIEEEGAAVLAEIEEEGAVLAEIVEGATGDLATENERLRSALHRVLAHENGDPHAHEREGVWDADNRPPLGGQPCARCHDFADAREALGLPRWPAPAEPPEGATAHRADCGCGRARR